MPVDSAREEIDSPHQDARVVVCYGKPVGLVPPSNDEGLSGEAS